MYTQCPECLTVYQIDEDALQASLGIVRCGRCDKRFDALRTLSDTLPIEPPSPLPEQEPGECAPTLTEAVPPSTIERAARKSRSGKPAAASAPTEEEAAPQSTTATGASADDWFADIESELSTSATAPDVPAPDTDNDTWMVELPEETRDSAAAEDARGTPVEDAGETSGPAPPADTGEEIPREPEPEALDFDGPLDFASGDANAEFDAPSPELDEVAEGSADAGAGEASPADTSIEVMPADAETEATAAPLPVYVRPRRRFSRASAMWTLGCVLLALLLAAQLAWANRVELFRDPATQPWVARVCRNIPCQLPLIRDTAKLELLSRDVRPDPRTAGALTITATVRNDAAFNQPWPVVVVVLTDLDNNPVAMRRFRPAEYMTDPARRAAGIAPGANAVVAFEVADPGKRAVAFQFGFE